MNGGGRRARGTRPYYERIHTNGIVYFVNGLGGDSWDKFHNVPVPGSVGALQRDFGRAPHRRGGELHSCFRFFTRWGRQIDSYRMVPRAKPEPAPACRQVRQPGRILNHRLGLLRRQRRLDGLVISSPSGVAFESNLDDLPVAAHEELAEVPLHITGENGESLPDSAV